MTFEEALEIAARAHAGQIDKQGEPYILHVMRVALAVPAEARRVAILHDLVEDTEWSFERLAEAGLPAGDGVALQLVTHDEKASYAEYIEQIATASGAAGEIARAVKIADLRDNHGRIPPEESAPPWGELRRRYERALAHLEPPGDQLAPRAH